MRRKFEYMFHLFATEVPMHAPLCTCMTHHAHHLLLVWGMDTAKCVKSLNTSMDLAGFCFLLPAQVVGARAGRHHRDHRSCCCGPRSCQDWRSAHAQGSGVHSSGACCWKPRSQVDGRNRSRKWRCSARRRSVCRIAGGRHDAARLQHPCCCYWSVYGDVFCPEAAGCKA